MRFDTQLLDDPAIEGKEYQQGTLLGTEIREYLLDRYHSTVAGYLETRCWNGSISVPVPVEAVTASKMQLLPVTDVTKTKDL